MQSVERDDVAGQVELAQQPLGRRDLVGLLADLEMRQHQVGAGVERVQQLRRLAVSEVIEAAPERLAIQRDGARRAGIAARRQAGGMAAEHQLDRRRIEPLEDKADGGVARCACPAQAEGVVQAEAVGLDEGDDAAIGVGSGHHGEDREQQDIGQLVELAFRPARVGDLVQQVEQSIERSHGNLLTNRLPHIDSNVPIPGNPLS